MSEMYNIKEMGAELISMLHLEVNPIAIKAFEKEEDIQQVPKCRRVPEGTKLTGCQVFAQSMNLGYTIAITKDIFAARNCGGICGMLSDEDQEEWAKGQDATGVWFAEPSDGLAHQNAVPTLEHGKYEAIVSTPMTSGRLADPDVCMVVAKPAQLFIMLAGYLRHDYCPLDTPISGESSCGNHWVRTIVTGKPNISLPCFAELRYAQYPADCMIFTMTPAQMKKAIDGMKELGRFGFRYPLPGYALMTDARKGFGKTYK